MATWRPTKVQKDVIDRMKDGWIIMTNWASMTYMLEKVNEPSRHVATQTFESLRDRGLIKYNGCCGWLLV